MPAQNSHSDEMNLQVDSLDVELRSEQPKTILESAPKSLPSAQAPPTPLGYHWRAIMDVEPGMVVARPVVGTIGSRVTMHLAIGSVITADTIAQLMNKGVECVAVLDDVAQNPAIYAEIVIRYEARLREIFEPKPDETCRPLFDALIKIGPCQC